MEESTVDITVPNHMKFYFEIYSYEAMICLRYIAWNGHKTTTNVYNSKLVDIFAELCRLVGGFGDFHSRNKLEKQRNILRSKVNFFRMYSLCHTSEAGLMTREETREAKTCSFLSQSKAYDI